MFLAILLLLFAVAVVAFMIFILSAGFDPTQWWLMLVLGLVALASLLGGLYKLEDETFCFTNMLNKRDERRAAKAKASAKEETAQKPKRAKKPCAAAKNVKFNIIAGAIVSLLLVGYAWLVLWILSNLRQGDAITSVWQYFSIVGIIVSALLFGFAGVLITMRDFTVPVFSGFHPVGKKIAQSKQFVHRVYKERGYLRALRRVGLIYFSLFVLFLGILSIFNHYALNLFVCSPLFFLSLTVIYDENDTYKDYIKEKSNCDNWEKFVCSCGTLIPGSKFVGRANQRETEDLYRETTTTTTTTTIGDTVYVDTDVDTDYYTVTNYSYDDVYICPNCKKKKNLHYTGSTKKYL